MTSPATGQSVLDQLQALSSAEDMFACLDLAYDPAVLNRARLHMMKRMGDYLAEVDFAALDEAAAFAAARQALQKAHADFETSTPRDQKALKIYKQQKPNMVQIQTIKTKE